VVKIVVDMDRCESFGMCCMEAEDVFTMGSDDKLAYRTDGDESQRAVLLIAADVCPTRAITVE
jgi:ferredoxin